MKRIEPFAQIREAPQQKQCSQPLGAAPPQAPVDSFRKSAAADERNPDATSMPTSKTLKEAFMEALKHGGVFRGNPPDCQSVREFKALFESGAAKPGDIILVGRNAKPELSMLDSVVPGDFSHVGVYIGKNDKGEHETIDAWVPGATRRSVEWWPQSYYNWVVIRPVKPDGSELSDEEHARIADFAKSAEGCAYNMQWVANEFELPVSPEKTKFYCSQLAWAAVKQGTGIDIDANPDYHPLYQRGVAPQELFDSKNVKVIARGDFTPGPLEPETLMRLAGGMTGVLAANSLTTWALSGAEFGFGAACGLVGACAVGACLGVWLGKIAWQAMRD